MIHIDIFLYTLHKNLFVEQQYKTPCTDFKENEIVEDKQPTGMASSMYIQRTRGLPSMTHIECLSDAEAGENRSNYIYTAYISLAAH